MTRIFYYFFGKAFTKVKAIYYLLIPNPWKLRRIIYVSNNLSLICKNKVYFHSSKYYFKKQMIEFLLKVLLTTQEDVKC
jgi:hypothetical protein